MTLKVKVKSILLVNDFPLYCWTKQLQTLQVHRSSDVEDTGPKVEYKSEIMYFLVNASPRLDVAALNFADALVSSKAGIPSVEV